MTITGNPESVAATGRRQLCLEHVTVGDETRVFAIPLTLQRLVMEAGVNRDFTPLHHDDEDTRRTGAPRAYANTMFIQALIEAGIRTWIGDRGRLRKLTIHMVAFNLAGTIVSTGGVVTAIDRGGPDAAGTVRVDLWVRSDDTVTVTGHAVVSLPASCRSIGGDAKS